MVDCVMPFSLGQARAVNRKAVALAKTLHNENRVTAPNAGRAPSSGSLTVFGALPAFSAFTLFSL